MPSLGIFAQKREMYYTACWYLAFLVVMAWACEPTGLDNDKIPALPTQDNALLTRETLLRATAEYPDVPDNYYRLALYYLDERQYEAALATSKQAVRLDSNNTKYQLALARAYQGNNQLDSALIAAQRSQRERSLEPLILLGELQYHTKNYDAAIRALNQALNITDRDARVYYWKAHIEIARLDSSTALRNLRLALDRKPNYYQVYRLYAELFNRLEMYATAIAYTNRGLGINPRYAPLYFQKAEAFRKRRFYDDSARINYEKALSLDKDLYMAGYYLGKYAFEQSRYDAADQYLKQVLRYNNKISEAHYMIAWCAYYRGQKQAALRAFEQATRLDPRNLAANEMYWKVQSEITLEAQRRREDSLQRAYYRQLEEQNKKNSPIQ